MGSIIGAIIGGALGFTRRAFGIVAGGLGKLNGMQILALALGFAFAADHLFLIAAHRRTAKIEAQSAKCAAALTGTRTAFDTTVANYRAAAAKAAADDRANAARAAAEAGHINQEQANEYQTRIAAARAVADRLQRQYAAAANSGSSASAGVPGVPAAARGTTQAASQDGFSIPDRLLATEQAIQLDQLIKAVRKLAAIDPNAAR